MNFKHALLILVFFSPLKIIGQDTISIHGFVKDAISNEPIENVSVYIDSTNVYSETNEQGYYKLILPKHKQGTSIIASRVDYQAKSKIIPEGTNHSINFLLSIVSHNLEIVVSEKNIEQTGVTRENIQELIRLPNNSNNLESLLSGIALGVNSGLGGELSAQYNVRGGNYDENLVYINGFEIYRPQLIRSSVREGLTTPNPDLVQKLTFSSGGFQAKYGDKMSSVLDIKYKKPESFAASFGLSLLGGTFHIEGKKKVGAKEKPFRYLLGIRLKNTEQLLNSFDTKAATTANFGDIQGYFTYQITPSLELSYLSNFNTNQYISLPEQSTTIASASKEKTFQLNSTFSGDEVTNYKYTMNGISLNYLPQKTKHPMYFNLSTSFYDNQENEHSDVLNIYEMNAIDSNTRSTTYGEIIDTVANGVQYDFIQNKLNIKIKKLQHRGGIELESSSANSFFIQWGLNYQSEIIKDEISELERKGTEIYMDQDGLASIPVIERINSNLHLSSNRYSGFIQNSFLKKNRKNSEEKKITTGVRFNYWDVNQVLFVSPRIQFFHSLNKHLSYHISSGLYAQSPFYRELRNKEGVLNKEVLPQKSWQIIGGLKHSFSSKKNKQPLQLVVEAYYKQLWDLVSYDYEDVRIRYFGENNAKGHAYGLDLRLNGNFITSAESWINVSFLRTRESIDGVQHKKSAPNNPDGKNINNVPRPSDRFLNLSIYFQDHFPSFKRLETYVNYSVGTGLPYTFEDDFVFRNNFRYRANHQLNIGFSFSLWKEDYRKHRPRHLLGFSKNAWISFDAINLLNIRTVTSNRIIPTANGVFSVPNYLTSRTMNVRFRIEL